MLNALRDMLNALRMLHKWDCRFSPNMHFVEEL